MPVLDPTTFQILVATIGSLASALLALAYFRRVRLERPPIGTFNPRDLAFLACFIVTLPLLYLIVPPAVLTGFLVVTFLAALVIALRPLVPGRRLAVVVPFVLTSNIILTRAVDDIPHGLQLYWLSTSAIVLVAAVGVANLYVQVGLTLRSIA
jgi:hypothetical protein